MPRLERSAGFVIYRVAPSTPGGRVYLLLNYGRHWDYAKGHVEAGETDLEAAVRELREETGLAPPRVVEGFTHEVEYDFRSSRHGAIRKKVIFFLGETHASKVILSEEHVGAEFLSYDNAMARLTYPTAREVLLAAEAHLNSLPAVGSPVSS
jgi:8-oxo-dGTP pyrophosphatase MutT (NUDIX family)